MNLQQAKQRAFDEAYHHVTTVGKASLGTVARERCSYSGIGCAASRLIRPEEREDMDKTANSAIRTIMEHSRAEEILQPWAVPFAGNTGFKALCNLIQRAHDDNATENEKIDGIWERVKIADTEFLKRFTDAMEIVRKRFDLEEFEEARIGEYDEYDATAS